MGVNSVCLSVEDDLLNMKKQILSWQANKAVPRVILYKDTPLFIAEACSLTALHGGCPTAEVCGYRTLLVENDEERKYHVAHENCKSIVFADEAYSISQSKNELSEIGVKEFRIDFLTRPYTKDVIQHIVNSCIQSTEISKTHNALTLKENFYSSLIFTQLSSIRLLFF